MGKIANIVGGICTGVCLSQFPEYSQQYVQRLGGAVDELTVVVQDFDRSAQENGMTRAAALASMDGSEFLVDRQADMSGTIARQERLSESYGFLRDAGAFQRLGYLNRFADPKIARRAWDDYQPAIPITWESLLMLILGYSGGYFIMAFLRRVWRRYRHGDLLW